MTENKPLLKIRNLTHKFSNGILAVNDVSFDIEPNDFLIISGPNGSGKSVLMKHLNGLLTPTSGEILLEEENIFHDIKKTRQKIGLVFQDADSQIVGQTVEKDTSFGPENLKLPRDEITNRVENALRDVSLLDKRKIRPHILSGGEKRRLAVAGVLAMNSPVLIFDEPFSNLDYPGVRDVLSHILDLHGKGHTIIVITHDLGKVLAHGKKLIIMKKGVIEYIGKPHELIDKLESCGIRKPESDKIENMTWLK